MDAPGWLAGACLLASLVSVARTSARRRSEQLAVAATVVAGLIVVWRLVDGPGFVPGLVAATPFAAVGLAWGFSQERSRFVVPLPLVFLFQFTGGAAPQWAGRYILPSGLLLAVVGVVYRCRLAPWARMVFVVLSVAVTAFGVSWLIVRSHEIGEAADRLQARPEAVLISPNGFVPREFGASYGDKDWLASGTDEDLRFAVEVVGESGRDSFALVDLDTTGEPPTFSGWSRTNSELVPFLAGVDLRVTTYARAD
jgi:hypothetical protein